MDNLMVIGAVLGAGLVGFLAARLLIKGEKTEGVPRAKLDQALQEIARLEGQCDALGAQLKELKSLREQTEAELRAKAAHAASLEAEKRVVAEQLSQLQAQFKTQFENLAASILEKNSEKFSTESNKRLQEILNPLRERFGEFQKKVEDSFGTQSKEQFSLKEEIKRIVETNEKMRLQTESLTQALKGDTKVQGDWGEIILERILEESGLKKDIDYVLQGEGYGMKHADDGSHLKPDAIVNLPENKHLIIDAKVSLTDYERYCAEGDEGHLSGHVAAMRRRVKELSERGYQYSEKLNTPDFVFMFVPIEGAFMLAMQHDHDLHRFAWEKRVVIVCPTTLFATMRTVASLWQIEARNRNAEEIAKRGGALYDKIEGFIKDMQNLDMHLKRASGSFDDAFGKLHKGQGNVLRQAEMLKDLGAKTTKQLPKALLEDDVALLEEAS